MMGLLGERCLAQQAIGISSVAAKERFPLVAAGKTAVLVTDSNDAKVTGIAAGAFSRDIEMLSGVQPVVAHRLQAGVPSVVIGTLGQSKLIDQLALKGAIPVNRLKGKWETFCIAVVDDPLGGKNKLLVIAGSDPRGTAFGVFELSRMLGVSPFVWWADVAPAHRAAIYITPGENIIGPPSVKYRGFFINDEDWGMRPWAAQQMDQGLKDIGPNTYKKVFELMLRLKANYLWPAMHPGTKAFWYYKENPALARDYAIVMGSSHHEPMLRNTEWEWNLDYKEEYGKAHGPWRYDTNKEEIYRFFDDRVKQSVNNEAVYTVGMRSTGDGAMQGPPTVEGKVKLLEEVIHDQRKILENRLQKPASDIPQVFCPYKEVLTLYRAGLQLPDDVTILWVDDNHGYIRQLPNPDEQKRSGGGGVYYHLSYWGAPQDYLWLCSTSPALIAYEMHKAYALNARAMWVFNVGDIKPAELELQFCMDLAWNVNAWSPATAQQYLEYWAGKTFGPAFAKVIAKIKTTYYQLAASGKPEHLDAIHFTAEEARRRLAAYQALVAETHALAKKIPASLQDAYFELIGYPVESTCSMNEKILYARESLRLAAAGQQSALLYAGKAKAADEHIHALTKKYNTETAGGKWNGMMSDHPRDRAVFNMPQVATPGAIALHADSSAEKTAHLVTVPAGQYVHKHDPKGSSLFIIKGLGAGGAGLTVWPLPAASYDEQSITGAPYATYQLKLRKGKNTIHVRCLPNFPLYPGKQLRYAVSVNNAKPVFVNMATAVDTKSWASNVLKGYAEGETVYESASDKTVAVRIYFPDPGLVVNAVSVE